jgi:WD40 repeat protein
MLLGSSETLLVASKVDGTLDLFNIRTTGHERYYLNFETNVNPLTNNEVNSNSCKYKLVMPLHTIQSSSHSKLVKLRKRVLEHSNSKVMKLYTLSADGIIEIFEINDNFIDEVKDFSKKIIKKLNTIDISGHFNNFQELGKLRCIDINFSRKSGSYSDILFVQANYGLIKLTLTGKNDFIINSICDINVTAFDVSDNGYIVAAFNDLAIRIYDEANLSIIYQVHATDLPCERILDKIYWSNIVCKADNNKLMRKSLLANIFVFTNKNEFILFDLNSKEKKDLKVKTIFDFRFQRKKFLLEIKKIFRGKTV